MLYHGGTAKPRGPGRVGSENAEARIGRVEFWDVTALQAVGRMRLAVTMREQLDLPNYKATRKTKPWLCFVREIFNKITTQLSSSKCKPGTNRNNA